MRGGTGCDEAAYMGRRIRDACVARIPSRKLIKRFLIYFRFRWGSVGRVIGEEIFFILRGRERAPSDAGADGRGCRDACAVGQVLAPPAFVERARSRGLARPCAVCDASVSTWAARLLVRLGRCPWCCSELQDVPLPGWRFGTGNPSV